MFFAFFLNCGAKLRTFMICCSVIAHKRAKKGLFDDLNQEKDKKEHPKMLLFYLKFIEYHMAELANNQS